MREVIMTHWVRFRCADGREGFGRLEGDQIREHSGDMYTVHPPSANSLPLDQVTLLCPCAPSKIIALWNNFHALAAKLGKAIPKSPLYLLKPATCTLGPGEPIRRPAAYKGKIAYEGELGIVIGKQSTNVPIDNAAAHILGYTCVNDVTASEVLNEDPNFTQWCRAKGYDTFGCIGPAISCGLDWSALTVVTRVDGVERQNYPLRDMVFSPEQLVSHLSHDMSLLPGDVIACGTSVGVGSFKDGATVEVAIEGIGTLTNRLINPCA
jgi:2-keto-4-pentenoate hydratase/2-oxohepta-3-ene-1,7-dioic acid hydratase in catechol pathway